MFAFMLKKVPLYFFFTFFSLRKMEDDEKAIQSIMEDLEEEEDIVVDSIVKEKMDAQRDALSDLLKVCLICFFNGFFVFFSFFYFFSFLFFLVVSLLNTTYVAFCTYQTVG